MDPPPLFSIQGIQRNPFTWDIQLQLNSQYGIKAVLKVNKRPWVTEVNPRLGLKWKVYPSIFHGISTMFHQTSSTGIQNFIDETHGVLDTATGVIWANKYSIKSGKPFFSMIVHLTDPVAANSAIRNCIYYKHMLNATEDRPKKSSDAIKALILGTLPRHF